MSVFSMMAAALIAVLGAGSATGQIETFAAAMLKAKDCIEQNYVLARGDSYTDHDSPGKKPWSVNWQTYGGNHPDSMPYCAGTDTLLESLKNGVRVPPEGISITNDLEMENAAGTWFKPSGCTFKWYTWHDACRILGKFSQVYLIGDSLMRQIHHALLMLLKDDFQYGAVPLHLDNINQYEKCQCDGQFSEHALCRANLASTATMSDPRQFAMCMGSSAQHFALYNRERDVRPLEQAYKMMWDNGACSQLDRPIVILLGAGSHHKHSARDTIHDVIEPLLHEVMEAALACEHIQFHLAYAGLGAQSRTLDTPYPWQKREPTAEFNEEVSEFLRKKHGLNTFDVWNLTKNAPTSDGYHHLSDVNLIKAQYFLNYLSMLA